MKKFTFSLDSLLNLRELEEQNAKAALARENAFVEQITMRIQELESLVEGAYGSWDGQAGRKFNSMDRMGLSAQIADLQKTAGEARSALAAAKTKRAKAMKSLQDATRNRKVVTNLKEKRFKEYTAEVLKQEANEIEDVFNARRSAR
ncbi:flagellar export protein FliJ [Pelagicoccus albus]|uniref:Flagellar FliJ protein n=1 Tax=Pelagicoccus albus TaxID=415222 RepID=A0A7X1E9Q4_9BACT|nr:flagellar export protein FliJ [Pelagicoccus albus]MBC2606007.1 flagellar export protein FliJ [Pelagicoccus albus]